jgi:hypothetical protein
VFGNLEQSEAQLKTPIAVGSGELEAADERLDRRLFPSVSANVEPLTGRRQPRSA